MRILTSLLVVFLFLCGASPVMAQKKKPTLRGSKAVQAQQNTRANREKLTRIQDDEQLRRFIRSGLLVRLPSNGNIVVDDRLDPEYRYCRPWTRDFLLEFGRAYRRKFPVGQPLVVTSAVRSAEYQEDLQGRNSNAARTSGPRASAHLVGSTVDITKREMARTHRSWAREYLLRFKVQGRGVVIEEFRQPVFHIMVFNVTKKPAVKKPAAKKPRRK